MDVVPSRLPKPGFKVWGVEFRLGFRVGVSGLACRVEVRVFRVGCTV